MSSLASASDGPKLTFTRYLIAIQSADSLDDIASFLSVKRLRRLNESPEEAQTLIKTEKRSMNVANMTLLNERLVGDNAELLFDLGDVASGSSGRRTVILVKEDGEWRIERID